MCKYGYKAFACCSIHDINSITLLGNDVANQSWTIRIFHLNFCSMAKIETVCREQKPLVLMLNETCLIFNLFNATKLVIIFWVMKFVATEYRTSVQLPTVLNYRLVKHTRFGT